MPRTTKALDRFMAFASKSPNDCWLWSGSSRGNGYVLYGLFWFKGKPQNAHRVSWQLFKGEIPRGKLVCHSCDNGLCVNPKHLFIGTYLDNSQDMQKKNRQGSRENVPCGEDSPQAKLSLASVLAIRNDNRPQSLIAKDYKISRSQVSRIKTYKRWKKEV